MAIEAILTIAQLGKYVKKGPTRAIICRPGPSRSLPP